MCNSSNSIDPICYYASLLERCIATKHLTNAKLLHSLLIKTSLNLYPFLANRLIHIYSASNSLQSAQKAFHDLPIKNTHSYNTLLSGYVKIGQLETARNVFDEMPQPNLVSYNSMISGLTHHGYHREALGAFRLMQRQSGQLLIDKFTVVGVVSACAGMAATELLRQVHAVFITIGIELNLIMYNVMIDAYGKCGDADVARWLFEQMPVRDVVSWTSMVAAYAQARRLEEARLLFHKMPVRNAVSWTALITGHAQNGDGHGALKLFGQMREEGILPSAFTFVGVLSACASLALVERGKQLHGHITRNNIMGTGTFNIYLYNALVDMYTKCGDMNSAVALFKQMPERDIVSWNSLLTGFALNGSGKQSLFVFERMIESGVVPNHVTFLGVLSACSHAGLISEGRQFLDSMEGEYGICPRSEHYAILIDALGRNNQLEQAMELIKSAPSVNNSAGMWGSLLGACRVHGNLDLARLAGEMLFDLEPENAARYVMLSNIYAAAGRWSDARQVRGLMKERGLKKEPGYSWIEVKNARCGFVAEDKSHEQIEEIYEMLVQLADQMSEVGYLAKNSQCHIPDEEDGIF
ncbi:pentatricopeptide repeat-containing-like protein [Cinnamomum micranthum f. kanehirae]|uniref:Pentatricopeptide repeat-containing-like protein n=1 Tax=Cinnamomum micranthum f. kanehirae TaxID=337451 RepID=A0A3S3QGM2_9MAGN|nr:pentatricopeptide repeat-containing-like protein [Cinnamomum micranthum f. kanehirae]